MLSIRLMAACACACACAVAAGQAESATASLLQGARAVFKTYRACEVEPSVTACLKLRALRLVDRAAYVDTIPLTEGVALVTRPEQRSLTAAPPPPLDENSLPTEPNQREERVDALLWERVAAFFQSHSLQVQVPRLVEESKALLDNEIDDEEGRGKKKKYAGPLLVGLMLKGFMVALAYKALALLAGKALIVSKLALVLAGIVALKKLFSGGEQKTTYEIVKQPVVSHAHQYTQSHEFAGHGADWAGSSGAGGYGRSLADADNPEPDAGGASDKAEFGGPAAHGRALPAGPYPHLVAYRAQIPTAKPQSV